MIPRESDSGARWLRAVSSDTSGPSLVDVIEGVACAISVHDERGRVLGRNERARALLGLGRSPSSDGSDDPSTWPVVDSDGVHVELDNWPLVECLRERRPIEDRIIGLRPPGRAVIWLAIDLVPTFDEGGAPTGAVVTMTDGTARRHADRAARTTARAMQLLVRARHEDELLRDICTTLVEAGGFALAWIGRAEADPAATVSILTSAGDTDYLFDKIVSWSESDPTGRGPSGRCLRDMQVQIANDLSLHVTYEPWRARAREFGFGASIALPFRLGDDRAALMIYAREIEAFDDGAVELLTGLTENVEFGVAHLRMEDVGRRALEHTAGAVEALSEGSTLATNGASGLRDDTAARVEAD